MSGSLLARGELQNFGTSHLGALGPVPLYIVLEIAIVVGVWALMTWPWVAFRGRRQPGPRNLESLGGVRHA